MDTFGVNHSFSKYFFKGNFPVVCNFYQNMHAYVAFHITCTVSSCCLNTSAGMKVPFLLETWTRGSFLLISFAGEVSGPEYKCLMINLKDLYILETAFGKSLSSAGQKL